MRVGTAAETDSEKVGTMREGKLDQKHLLFGEDGSPNNFDLNTGLTGGGGWRTPRHRHNFDQIRYVLKGRLPYSETDFLEEGWLGYFPESVHYGPQERAEGLQTVVLQCGGASGAGYLSVAQREAVNAELNETGEFKKGMYTFTDENGTVQTVDGSQAIFERAMGHKLEFATPRYTDVIAMNPEAYDWLPQGDPGVQEKWVGTFTERNLAWFPAAGRRRRLPGRSVPLHRDPLPDQGPGLDRGKEVRSRDRVRIPGKRGPDPRRGHRANRIPACGSAPVLSRRSVTGLRRSVSHPHQRLSMPFHWA